jgi:hypothetical protein
VIRDDDDAWLDALAGRIEPLQFDTVQSRDLVLEALALREFIRRQELPTTPGIHTVDAARELELIARARREGLLVSAAQRQLPRYGLRRLGFSAAALVVIAVGIGLWRSSLTPQETLRGVDHGTVHLQAQDPPALKRQLTEELTAAGATVSGYERLGRLGIDVDLPQPLPTDIVKILERHHIPVPSDEVLVVEIERPSSR